MIAKKFKLPIGVWLKERKRFIFRKNDFFAVKLAENNLNHSRFGVVVSKNILKSAVKRNKLKRAIFNFIKLGGLCASSGRDFLITALPKSAVLKKGELEKSLKHLL